MKTDAVTRRLSSILLFLGPATTLAVSPFANFDPINLVKMILVSGLAFSLLAFLLFERRKLVSRLPRTFWLTTCFFLFWMFVVFFASGAPYNQQFWGVFGRNNGLLSYSSLIIILVSVALVQEKRFYHKLVDALVLTAVPTTLYALVQVAGRDPVPWSVMEPFATLGNVNFSSAFFGLAAICATVLAFLPGQGATLRGFLILMVITDLFIILETGSIQGFMIYIAGIGIVGFFIVRSSQRLRFLQLPFLVFGFVGFVFTALALKNVGPLARFVFGETILFRFDYWFAGWAMTLKHPIFGVGLDSYGDWYREVRGEIATLRTTPDRITNTAHNIYLDISAAGGFPLIISYLFLLGLAFRAAFKIIKRTNSFNHYFVALFASWIAFLIQAAISINQIGVAIWGWLFTGAMIGYEISTRREDSGSQARRAKNDLVQLPAAAALFGFTGFIVGFFLAFIPFNADARFKDALQAGNPIEQFNTAKALGATAFHMELALDAAVKANNDSLAAEITEELLRRYPRDFMAWRVKQVLTSTSMEDREEAYRQLKVLDPHNPNVQRVG